MQHSFLLSKTLKEEVINKIHINIIQPQESSDQESMKFKDKTLLLTVFVLQDILGDSCSNEVHIIRGINPVDHGHA